MKILPKFAITSIVQSFATYILLMNTSLLYNFIEVCKNQISRRSIFFSCTSLLNLTATFILVIDQWFVFFRVYIFSCWWFSIVIFIKQSVVVVFARYCPVSLNLMSFDFFGGQTNHWRKLLPKNQWNSRQRWEAKKKTLLRWLCAFSCVQCRFSIT